MALAVVGLVVLAGGAAAQPESDRPNDSVSPSQAPPERPVVIGTAPVAGVYYPAGGALCSRLSAERTRHGLRCLVETTGGSPDNLARLREGSIDFALIQSDWQFLAVRNGLEAQGSPFKDLRAVFSLHALPVTLVAAPGSGIESLADLEGRRVNLGPPGSGVR
ncbi:MAG TPA: TAXI family TRAP transporter solute-binding subunit, partial [Kiloniellales bacterium]|nr:TAXI family TRAP transporter solute-binding subunit [Kiloniellales bacterium]